jgi:hypothetical protein
MHTDNSLKYEMVSVHFDRINIVKRFERNAGKSDFKFSSLPIVKPNNEYLLNLFPSSDTVKIRADVYNRILLNDCLVSLPDIPSKIIKYTTDDKLSKATQSKMSKSIRYLNFVAQDKNVTHHQSSQSIKFKIAFITLTLSSVQVHTDNEIKNKLLNQLFIEFKNKYKVTNYVWRCEKQLNGNVHFHILVDKFIPHAELREIWNRLQNKLGYVDRYQNKMQNISYKDYADSFKYRKSYTESAIRTAYAKGKATNWKYPNSTDVHSLQFIKDIDSYLCKYMVKNEQNEGIVGRLWGCSHSLSNIKGGTAIVDTNISGELSKLFASGHSKFFTSDYYTIVFEDIMFLKYIGCNILFDLYREFLINHFKLESS